MPSGLRRYHHSGQSHFLTFSCYRREPRFQSATTYDLFLTCLESMRKKLNLRVYGYVVMPEHFHLLISEPERDDPSVVLKVVKQRFARKVRPKRSSAQLALWEQESDEHLWQKRFYDFNVWSERKRVEKLRYIHRNPVKRGLVESPEQWA